MLGGGGRGGEGGEGGRIRNGVVGGGEQRKGGIIWPESQIDREKKTRGGSEEKRGAFSCRAACWSSQ